MMSSTQDRLCFVGTVIKGSGCFSEELEVPGEPLIPGMIRDWPQVLKPGTLNVLVDPNGYPEEFVTRFGKRIEALDKRDFLPEAELHHSQICNNTLAPKKGEREDKGNAQIWRARLKKLESSETLHCWVLRRIGSNMPSRLECVAGVKIREVLDLPVAANPRVELIIEGTWKRA